MLPFAGSRDSANVGLDRDVLLGSVAVVLLVGVVVVGRPNNIDRIKHRSKRH